MATTMDENSPGMAVGGTRKRYFRSRGGTRHKALLIVDNLRVHCARLVTDWAQANRHRIELFYLPRRWGTDTLRLEKTLDFKKRHLA